jgi:hypothetical protein
LCSFIALHRGRPCRQKLPVLLCQQFILCGN